MNSRALIRLVALVLACAWILASAGAVVGAQQAATVKDPVCGMKIDPAKAKGKVDHNGKTYYFCSDDCKAKFQKEPAKYADKSPK
jgi:Cu+-exporting ATPase